MRFSPGSSMSTLITMLSHFLASFHHVTTDICWYLGSETSKLWMYEAQCQWPTLTCIREGKRVAVEAAAAQLVREEQERQERLAGYQRAREQAAQAEWEAQQIVLKVAACNKWNCTAEDFHPKVYNFHYNNYYTYVQVIQAYEQPPVPATRSQRDTLPSTAGDDLFANVSEDDVVQWMDGLSSTSYALLFGFVLVFLTGFVTIFHFLVAITLKTCAVFWHLFGRHGDDYPATRAATATTITTSTTTARPPRPGRKIRYTTPTIPPRVMPPFWEFGERIVARAQEELAKDVA